MYVSRSFFHLVRFLSFLFFLHCLAEVSGQELNYKNYNVNNGLASNEVYDILEDKKGMLWFATDQGVSRFNGYEFRNYTVAEGLPNNTIFGFHEDAKDRVWLRPFYGNLSYIENDSVYNVLEEKKFGRIYSIYVDDSDTVWFSTRDFQYKAFEVADGRYVCQTLDDYFFFREINSSTKGFILGALKAEEEQFYYMNGKVRKFQFSTSSWGSKKLSLVGINGFYKTENEVWADFGKVILSIKGDTVAALKRSKLETLTLNLTKKGDVFVGSSEGICKIDEDFQELDCILEGLNIAKVVQDREGGYWFSSLSQGVFYTPNTEVQIFKLGESSNIFKLICDNDGRIVAFGRYGDVYLHENSKLVKKHVSKYNKRELGRVELGEDGAISAGVGSFLVRVEGYHITKSYQGLFFYSLDSLFEISYSTSKFRIRKKKNTEDIRSVEHPVRVKRYREYTDKDTVYLPTVEGLFRYDSKNKLKQVGAQFEELSSRINAVVKDKYGHLWIGTNEQGLVVLKGDQLVTISHKDKSIGNICRNVVVDDNCIWASTELGLLRVNINDYNQLELFGLKDGLLSNSIQCIYATEHDVLLGHGNGVTQFPKQYRKHLIKPLLEINSVFINNEAVALNSRYQLNSDNGPIRITFTGISYHLDLKYKYRLKGRTDNKWSYTTERSVDLLSIPSGEYTFEVCAIDSEGMISEPFSIQFVVAPAIWFQWWFVSLLVIFVSLGIYFYNKRRFKRINSKVVLERKMLHAEQQALRARMTPHFTFNTLNSVQAYIMANDKKNANKYLSLFSKLIRMILDHSADRLISIEQELKALELYIQLERLRFKDKLEHHIIIDELLDIHNNMIPPLLLQPYVENAIGHGIMHKESSGNVAVQLLCKADHILCIIEDDGVGREKAKQLKEARNGQHKSFGMEITANRIELMRELYQLDFSLRYKDLKKDNKAVGTRVEIKIPYLKKELYD